MKVTKKEFLTHKNNFSNKINHVQTGKYTQIYDTYNYNYQIFAFIIY